MAASPTCGGDMLGIRLAAVLNIHKASSETPRKVVAETEICLVETEMERIKPYDTL